MKDDDSFFSYGIDDKSVGTEIWLACPNCGDHIAHKIISALKYSGGNDSIRFWGTCQIVMCQGCKHMALRKTSGSSEDPEDTVELYPSRIINHKLLEDAYYLPSQIYTIYRETHNALCSGLLVLAGIGIRALVESVCKEKGTKERILEKQIDDMAAKGIVTKENAEILHSTRLMGNAAAHEIKAHNQQLLEVALEIVENMLTAVYIIPEKASQLPKRPATSRKGKGTEEIKHA